MPPDFRDVDPRELRLPSSRAEGADPTKLQRQIAQFGMEVIGKLRRAYRSSPKVGDRLP